MLAVGVVLTAVFAGACLAPLAWAKIAYNTIDPTATLKANGRLITVTGPVVTDTAHAGDCDTAINRRDRGGLRLIHRHPAATMDSAGANNWFQVI